MSAETAARIGSFLAGLRDCETERAVDEFAVDAAADRLDADATVLATVDDGAFYVRAAHVPGLFGGPRLDADEGIAGRTVEADEPLVVDDLRSSDAATAGDFRAVLSVPTEEGVFQALSTTSGAFSPADCELATTLTHAVAEARERVQHSSTAEQARDRALTLFENVPDPAVRYSVEGEQLHIQAVNSAFVRVFGYPAEAAVGCAVADLLVPDDVESIAEHTLEADEPHDPEVTRQTADGPEPFLLRRVPGVDTADDSHGYCIYTDISELKERERELERQNERLDQFASVVSHDLRNPLSVATTYTRLVQENGELEHLETVEESHDRMQAIIEDVLAMARGGQEVADPERVSLEAIAEAAWETVETSAAALTTEDAQLYADARRLRRLLENLFRNAVEHGAADVTVSVGPHGDGFYVADDGPGIPADQRERVFDPGITESDDGTGLGLTTVREIAHAHDWESRVTESDAGGARFEFVPES